MMAGTAVVVLAAAAVAVARGLGRSRLGQDRVVSVDFFGGKDSSVTVYSLSESCSFLGRLALSLILLHPPPLSPVAPPPSPWQSLYRSRISQDSESVIHHHGQLRPHRKDVQEDLTESQWRGFVGPGEYPLPHGIFLERHPSPRQTSDAFKEFFCMLIMRIC